MSADGHVADQLDGRSRGQQLTQSGHVAPARSPLDKEGRWLRTRQRPTGLLARWQQAFRCLTLIHSVQNHTDDNGNYGTTYTTADQLTRDRC